ncbi:MAG: hypothetical protein MUF72_21870 [Elainella sp. Prado103]|jgi:type II secretory ATPase GspE/PulE/Tfp pilus assembly ATPase PilB-like protein|nr:hypothetical protein [Elainella sp. Prado103]
MTSRSDDPNVSNLSSLVHQQILAQFQGDWVSRLDIEQLFTLIDGVLPFEACLYYQVLPLYLEGNRLHLGMVSPDDTSASDYVRRIISYLNYSLVSHEIPSEALRIVLTAYLNHVGNQPIGAARPAFSYGHYRHASRNTVDQQTNPNERLTLVVDSPEDLLSAEAVGEVILSPIEAPPPIEMADSLPVTLPVPDGNGDAEAVAELSQVWPTDLEVEPIPVLEPEPELGLESAFQPPLKSDEIVGQTLQGGTESVVQFTMPTAAELMSEPELDQTQDTTAEVVPSEGSSPEVNSPELDAAQPVQSAPLFTKPPLSILNLAPEHLQDPVESLMRLSASQFLKELLARVLVDGIGRLYFECHATHGRIIWSQNGILQSVLDHLALPLFQNLIQELKGMANIPLTPIEQPLQAEMECLYDCTRVLLRFRFMSGSYGEEATVQVLRGAALKFYQQQQLNNLEKDAFTIAQQLQNKLHEIRAKAYGNPSFRDARSEMMPKLIDLLHRMEEELNTLDPEQSR